MTRRSLYIYIKREITHTGVTGRARRGRAPWRMAMPMGHGRRCSVGPGWGATAPTRSRAAAGCGAHGTRDSAVSAPPMGYRYTLDSQSPFLLPLSTASRCAAVYARAQCACVCVREGAINETSSKRDHAQTGRRLHSKLHGDSFSSNCDATPHNVSAGARASCWFFRTDHGACTAFVVARRPGTQMWAKGVASHHTDKGGSF